MCGVGQKSGVNDIAFVARPEKEPGIAQIRDVERQVKNDGHDMVNVMKREVNFEDTDVNIEILKRC